MNLKYIGTDMENHTLKSARFTDNARTTIVASWTDNDNPNTVRESYMVVDETNAKFKNLLKIYTLDQIEEDTEEYGKREQENIIAFHKRLIENGQASTTNNVEDNGARVNEDLIEFVCKYNEKQDEHSESLFELKLAIFDMEEIAESSDDTLKESIRVAKTPYELICVLAESGLFSALKKAAPKKKRTPKKSKTPIDSILDSE